MLFRVASAVVLLMIGHTTATHPHFQCAAQPPFQVNNWFEWANCEWKMEHPQKCKEGHKQKMMTCQVTCQELKPDVDRICEKAKIDLTILLDGSGSVKEQNFDITKNFVKDIVKHLDLGADKTAVNIFQFSDRHDIEVMNATNKRDLLERITNMDYQQGDDTQTGAALEFVNLAVFMNPMQRHDATPVLIVVTDGKARDDFQAPVDVIHSMGIETVAVGVGSGVDIAELAMIASKPSNVHISADFTSLEKLQEQLTEEICTFVVSNGGHRHTTTVAPSTVPTMSSIPPSSSMPPASDSVIPMSDSVAAPGV